jgi:NRAMP (natural resistance-associated macrophage protein)-like metal ion transporter
MTEVAIIGADIQVKVLSLNPI